MVPLGSDVLAFHEAVTDWVYANYAASWTHKAAIRKLASIPDVEAYDIQVSWPANTLD